MDIQAAWWKQTSIYRKNCQGKSDFVTIELTEESIDVSDKLAIVRHHLSAQTNDSEIPGTVMLKVLLVYQFRKGQRMLNARQAVKV
jgi:hypothetical protein